MKCPSCESDYGIHWSMTFCPHCSARLPEDRVVAKVKIEPVDVVEQLAEEETEREFYTKREIDEKLRKMKDRTESIVRFLWSHPRFGWRLKDWHEAISRFVD